MSRRYKCKKNGSLLLLGDRRKKKNVIPANRSIYPCKFMCMVWSWATRMDGSRNNDDDVDEMSRTHQTQLGNERRREIERLSRSFHHVHFDTSVVRCFLMISELYCIWMSDTMRNTSRRSSSDSKFLSLSLLFLTLCDYSSIHFQCNGNEWVVSRPKSEISHCSCICAHVLSLSFSIFNTK